MKQVLTINGSTRAVSANALFIQAMVTLAGDRARFAHYPSIADLPHFNPDLDNEAPPPAVLQFRALLRSADAVLICTPEYAMGVVGSLKNALDWCVSSGSLSGKPVMLVTASLNGENGHAALLETLRVIEADVRPGTAVRIPFARTKVNADAVITDAQALADIRNALDALLAAPDRPVDVDPA